MDLIGTAYSGNHYACSDIFSSIPTDFYAIEVAGLFEDNFKEAPEVAAAFKQFQLAVNDFFNIGGLPENDRRLTHLKVENSMKYYIALNGTKFWILDALIESKRPENKDKVQFNLSLTCSEPYGYMGFKNLVYKISALLSSYLTETVTYSPFELNIVYPKDELNRQTTCKTTKDNQVTCIDLI